MSTLKEAKQLQNRTKVFAVRIIKAFASLPKDEAARIIGRQFLRSGTSLAANYRPACRGAPRLISFQKISVVAKEADETLFWFELLLEAELAKMILVEPMPRTAEDFFCIARNGEAKSLNH